jgi:nucleoside-diphosphate-sugar epimerase
MKTALIGYTGFVGSNLLNSFKFTHLYNSQNISEIKDEVFDIIICAGVTANKFWANNNASEDLMRINELLDHLRTVKANNFVLISTIDVYGYSQGVDEYSIISNNNHAYGLNRKFFELQVLTLFDNVLTIRLPGLFGRGLKKNVIYDLLNNNCLDMINPESEFQYYNLDNLYSDINLAISSGLKLVNFVSEPIRTSNIINLFFPNKIVGFNMVPTVKYDIQSIHSAIWGNNTRYLYNRDSIMDELRSFVDDYNKI